MTYLAAIIAATVLFAVVGLHVALASGAPLGRFAWGGQHQILSSRRRLASVASAIMLACFAWIILIHGEVLVPVAPRAWTRVALWVFAAQFSLNTLANLASKSLAEKTIMGAATAILAACCLVLALAG